MMKTLVSGFTLLLTALPALADEGTVAPPPRVEADPTAMIVSLVLLVGMIGGFVFYVWWKDRNGKKNDAA